MKKLLHGLKSLLGEQKNSKKSVSSPDTQRQLLTFQKDIKYKFRDQSLLQLALKHRSWQGEQSNRRGGPPPRVERDGEQPRSQRNRQPRNQRDGQPRTQGDGQSRTQRDGQARTQRNGQARTQRDGKPRNQNNKRDLDTNERLEFLGDSVLNLIVSENLFRKYPDKREGEMTRYKSLVVNGAYLTKRAIDIGLGRLIFMSNAEEKMGGRKRNSILEDAYEALIGAIYLDGGLAAARSFIDLHVLEQADVEKLDVRNRNHKSALLEFAQGRRLGMPEYKTLEVKGPDHQRMFEIEVLLQNIPLGRGEGKSKKGAQQQAADRSLKALNAPNSELLRKLVKRK